MKNIVLKMIFAGFSSILLLCLANNLEAAEMELVSGQNNLLATGVQSSRFFTIKPKSPVKNKKLYYEVTFVPDQSIGENKPDLEFISKTGSLTKVSKFKYYVESNNSGIITVALKGNYAGQGTLFLKSINQSNDYKQVQIIKTIASYPLVIIDDYELKLVAANNQSFITAPVTKKANGLFDNEITVNIQIKAIQTTRAWFFAKGYKTLQSDFLFSNLKWDIKPKDMKLKGFYKAEYSKEGVIKINKTNEWQQIKRSPDENLTFTIVASIDLPGLRKKEVSFEMKQNDIDHIKQQYVDYSTKYGDSLRDLKLYINGLAFEETSKVLSDYSKGDFLNSLYTNASEPNVFKYLAYKNTILNVPLKNVVEQVQKKARELSKDNDLRISVSSGYRTPSGNANIDLEGYRGQSKYGWHQYARSIDHYQNSTNEAYYIWLAAENVKVNDKKAKENYILTNSTSTVRKKYGYDSGGNYWEVVISPTEPNEKTGERDLKYLNGHISY